MHLDTRQKNYTAWRDGGGTTLDTRMYHLCSKLNLHCKSELMPGRSFGENGILLLKSANIRWTEKEYRGRTWTKSCVHLVDCPCPRLARGARLSSITIGNSLQTDEILVYAVLGRFAPYVAQLGDKTREARTPIQRLVEHIHRAKYLFNHFTRQRRTNLRTAGKLGNRPSLPRTLVRLGGHKASILPLQRH